MVFDPFIQSVGGWCVQFADLFPEAFFGIHPGIAEGVFAVFTFFDEFLSAVFRVHLRPVKAGQDFIQRGGPVDQVLTHFVVICVSVQKNGGLQGKQAERVDIAYAKLALCSWTISQSDRYNPFRRYRF